MTGKAKDSVNHNVPEAAPAPRDAVDCGADHVTILLGLYDGAANIDAQLDSYLTQTHGNWSLTVADDGSRDDSPERIRAFSARTGHPVALTRGPGRGFAKNFLFLLEAAGPVVPFAALSDQDDVWLPGKLERALAHLGRVPEGRPALYAARTVVCDANLRPLRRSPRFELPPSFENALVQSIGGGNTMVLNRAALDLVQETARHADGIVAHDWWLYLIVSGADGTVIYDPEPSVLYRQHGGNLIGANDTSLASLVRIGQVLRGRFRAWNAANIRALDACAHWLTPAAREKLNAFKAIRGGTPLARLRALRASGIYRQTRRGRLALWLAAVTNRI